MKIVDDSKVEPQRQTENKPYGQSLERTRQDEQELTQQDQAKLIENVLNLLFSSSRPLVGFQTQPLLLTSANRPSKTMEEGILIRLMVDLSMALIFTRTMSIPTEGKTTQRIYNHTQWLS